MNQERVRTIGAELEELKIDFREQSVICVFGQAGAGKTTVAEEIGNILGIPVLSSDVFRRAIFQDSRYETGHSARAMWEMTRKSGKLFKSGVPSVVLDATFSSKKLRQNVDALARKHKKRIVWVEVVSDIIAPEHIDGKWVPRKIDPPNEIKKRIMVNNSARGEDSGETLKRLVEEFVNVKA